MPDTKPTRKAFWPEELEFIKPSIMIDGIAYRYTVVQQELAPDLPCFAGMPNGDLDLLFVSEQLYNRSKIWTEAVLTHELNCNLLRVSVEQPERCTNATAAELEHIDAEEQRVYLEMRAAFYTGLLANPKICGPGAFSGADSTDARLDQEEDRVALVKSQPPIRLTAQTERFLYEKRKSRFFAPRGSLVNNQP